MLLAAPRESSPGEALALGPALLAKAEIEGVPCLAASVVRGPAILLGAMQRAGRVVGLDACAAAGTDVLRRATAGTAAYVGQRAIVWTLALPHVASLVADATPRTLLNRNVRGFLKGLSRSGAVAHYFGREWISVRHRPAALLGFETSPAGAVLIEVIAGVETSIALPAALQTEEERAVDRWLGKVPAGLAEVMAGEPLEIAFAVMRTVALRAAASPEIAPSLGPGATALQPVAGDDDPMPPGFVPVPGARVPIGWIDAGVDAATGRVWIGGDVLVPSHVLRAIGEGDAAAGDVPIEGASLDDLREARRRASSPERGYGGLPHR